MRTQKSKHPTSTCGIKGFFRVQLVNKKTRKVEGDSGWIQNVITNYGFASCLVGAPIQDAGSVLATGLALGTGVAAIATSATKLGSQAGAASWYSTFGPATVASLTARMTQTFEGLAAISIAEIGVFAASNGTLIAGNTFDSSAMSTDQDVNCTYDLVYARA